MVRDSSRIQFLAIVSVLVGSVLGAACEVIGGENETPPSIDHEIEFRLTEMHEDVSTPEAPTLFFAMQTKETFGCLNHQICYQLGRSDHQITIRVTGIEPVQRGYCLPAVGPATARRHIPLDPGTYSLLLLNGSVRDEYTVTVTDQKVEVEPRTQRWTTPTDTLYWRYPRNTFAYYCEGPTEQICSAFEAQLETLPLPSIALPERGVWPYNRRRRLDLYLNAPGQFYRYPDEKTWNEVETRLREFACGRDAADIEVRNWLNEGIHSWRVDCDV